MPRLVDDLRRDIVPADYEEARAQFEALCREEGVDSQQIGYFGSVSFAGISDLDALLVGPPATLVALRRRFDAARAADQRLAYIFWHPPAFLLPQALSLSAALHTLEGLQMRAPSAVELPRPANEDRVVLHLVWFTYLQAIVASLSSRDALGIRMLLLVHKNLAHTADYFGSMNGSLGQAEDLPTPQECRKRCWESQDFIEKEAWGVLLRQLAAAQRQVDEFCSGNTGLAGPPTGAMRPLMIAGRLAAAPYDGSVSSRRVAVVRSNPITHALLQRCLDESSAAADANDALTAYARRWLEACRLYRGLDVPFPFASPFGLPTSTLARARLRWLGRLLALRPPRVHDAA